MAPDLSNVTRSPGSIHAALNTTSSSTQDSPRVSRRTSSIMAPPPVPQNSSLPNSPHPPVTMDGPGFGAGPIRHPRPLTAAELHLELEKEQESIVNRLTRELSALRAQTASVASTTSSTSDLFTSYPPESHLYPYQTGITPTSARRHRSSSNLSSRSARSARDGIANAASVTSVSGVAAPRDRERDIAHPSHSHQASSRPSMEISRPEISRQNSMSGVYRTGSNTGTTSTTSPALTQSQLYNNRDQRDAHQQQQHPPSRHSVSSSYGAAGVEGHNGRSSSTSTAVAAARYEEAAQQRAELEAVKRENEALKMRIRELERSLNGQQGAGSSSQSASTNAVTNGITNNTNDTKPINGASSNTA